MNESTWVMNRTSLVARAFQIEALQAVLEDVRQGHGRSLLVTGEAGIGKSRLLQEFRKGTVELGILTLQGNCLESDLAQPFSPIVDALRRFLSNKPSDEISNVLGMLAPELVKLMPELSLFVPEWKPTPSLAPEQEKRRMFEVLTQFFLRLAENGVVLLVVEDIHWSDDTSLEFMQHLARRSTGLPLLMLLTARPEPVSAGFDQFLTQMNRERLSQEMRVPPLSMDAVGALLRSMFDWQKPVKQSLLKAIYELTEGNPFFVEEVVNTLISIGKIFHNGSMWQAKPLTRLPIPHSLRQIVQQRTGSLSSPAAELLALAAVAGHKFDFEMLTQLTSHEEMALLVLIKELIAAQLVAEYSQDTFTFRHALTREAIYSGLLARERQHWHKAIADYYQIHRETDTAHLSRLAYHSYEAGDWENALHFGKAAGIQALQNFVPFTALAHFARATEAASRLTQPLPPEIIRQRGLAHQMVGNLEEALADFKVTLENARTKTDRRAEWQALFDLGYLWMARDYIQAGSYLQEALSLARTLEDPSVLAYSLNRLGNWNANVGRPLVALTLHAEALSIFENLGDGRGLAITHDLIASAHGITGNVTASTQHYRRALALFEDFGDLQGMASSLTMLTRSGTIEYGKRAISITQEIGWRDGEAYAHIQLSQAYAFQGAIDSALNHCQRGLEIALEIEHILWQIAGYQNLGIIFYFSLALDRAGDYVRQALQKAQASGAQIWADSSRSLLALIRLANGDVSGASEVLPEVQLPISQPESLGTRYLAWAQAETALAQGKPEQARAIVEGIIANLPHLHQWQDRTLMLFYHVRGRAFLALGRVEEAQESLQESITLCEDFGMQAILWRCHADLARRHLTARDRIAAEKAWMAAHQCLTNLARTIPQETMRQNFQRAAEAYLPLLPDLTPLQQSKQAFGGLTRREQQIALLIAQGKTNKEIAAELFISLPTTKTHITAILTKLNLVSRTQIAAWVIAKRLNESKN
jgi:DNA-binding CsgD family transcriptional regulator